MSNPRPRDRLDRRLARQRLRPRHARAVALHESVEPARDEDGAATPATLGHRVSELGKLESHTTRMLPRVALQAILAEQRGFLVEGVDALLDRLADGRIRALHGSLSCRVVWAGKARRVRFPLPAPPALGDVAEDVAGLALDLRARRGARLAEVLAAAYALAADDYGLYRVLDFYERDVACRRAFEAASSGNPETREPAPHAYVQAALASGRPALTRDRDRRRRDERQEHGRQGRGTAHRCAAHHRRSRSRGAARSDPRRTRPRARLGPDLLEGLRRACLPGGDAPRRGRARE